MPSKTKAQHNLMAMVANDPKAAKRLGIPQSVGKEFMKKDKGKKFAEGGKASFTALDEEERPSRGGRSATASFTALDEEGRPYRSGSRQGTSSSPRTTRFTALDKDGKPPRNAVSGLTDKEIDRLFESGKFRVGRGETPKRISEVDGMRRGGRVKKYAKGGSVSSASKRADGIATKGKTRGKFV